MGDVNAYYSHKRIRITLLTAILYIKVHYSQLFTVNLCLTLQNTSKSCEQHKNRVDTKFDGQNSSIIQGCFKDLFMIFKDVKMLRKCRVAARIRAIGAQCITLRAKSKDFKDNFQN